jgi:hypothetical protein
MDPFDGVFGGVISIPQRITVTLLHFIDNSVASVQEMRKNDHKSSNELIRIL